MPLIPVILRGGAGSRLWPVSREMHPKPCIRLSDGQSLLQKAKPCCTMSKTVSSAATSAW
jgi:mannose-1-phosphate guanylyltransferase